MLYIMRHGKTDWNAKHKIQGRTDIPLNEEGRRTAEQAAKEYADIPLDTCYCSPLIRAKETAEIVLKERNIPIIPDERLMEMGFGIYEGLENSFSIPDCPINVLFQNPENYRNPDGGAESLEALYARTGEFLKEVVEPQLQRGKNILIVGHGAMNSSIICQVKGLAIDNFLKTDLEQCKMIRLL
jgi:probable phosphoglycerate mutase